MWRNDRPADGRHEKDPSGPDRLSPPATSSPVQADEPVRPPPRDASRPDQLTQQLENDMRCATGTSGPVAHINAHTNAHINAHIIFPRASVIFQMRRTAFYQLRTPFWRVAHIISPAAHTILS